MTIEVDVLVPTTGRPCLDAALHSVARALLPNDDVTLHLRVVRDDDRRGPAWARNQAAAQGSAPYLALLDDDDLWLPGRLTKALQVLASRPEVALVCGEALPLLGGLWLAGDPRGTGRPATVLPGDRTHGELARDCFVALSTVTMRRADWESAGGMPEDLRHAEDYALWLRLTRGGRLVHVLPDALARLHTEGVVSASSDVGAMATGTLEALRREADPDMVTGDRRGPLLATLAFEAAKAGRGDEARARAREALDATPRRAMAWRAALRALV